MTAALLERLLAPISPGSPAGADVSYSEGFDEIRRLRKGDDPSLSQGEWVHEIRMPQWPKVRDICETILRSQSKDLQVACWYVESLANLEGFPGLALGFGLIEGLLSGGLSALFPADVEEQIARIEWLDVQMPAVIGNIPMTSPKVGGHTQLKWEESRLVENLGLRDPQAKAEAIAEGKLSGEAWDKAASTSGQGFYLNLSEQIQNARQRFAALKAQIDHRYGGEGPGLEGAGAALQACEDLVGQMLRRFGLDARPQASTATTLSLAAPLPPVSAIPSSPIPSRTEAIRHLREVARYFRDHEPHSPVGPLVERAARWGEMPLAQWLTRVIKDENTLSQLRDLLDLQPEL